MKDKVEQFWDIESYQDVEVPPLTADEARTVARVLDIVVGEEESRYFDAPKYDPIIVGMEPSSLVSRIARNSIYGIPSRLGEMCVLSSQANVGKSLLIDESNHNVSELIHNYMPYTYPEMHWHPDDILNTNGPRGSSRKSNGHAKKKRKAQDKSRRINRSK